MLRTAIILFTVILVVNSFPGGVIWETGVKDYFNARFQKVPPLKETAARMATYFLKQPSSRLTGTQNPKSLEKENNPGRHKRFAGVPIHYDVVMIMDSSRSVGKKDFALGLDVLTNLIPRARPDTHYAAASFNAKARIEFPFIGSKEAHRRMGKIRFSGGLTNTQEVLEKVRLRLFMNESSGMRPLAFKRILIVTDGQSNMEKEKTLYAALKLKMMAIEIFVVAVGDYIKGIHELVGLASSSDAHLYRVKNMEDFAQMVKLIPTWNMLRAQQNNWLSQMNEGKMP